MKGKKKQKDAAYYRKGMILTLSFWGAGLALLLLIGILVTGYVHQLLTEEATEVREPQYWERYDLYYDPDASIDIKTRNSIFAYTFLFNTIDWDYDTIQSFASSDPDGNQENEEDNGPVADFMENVLFDGFHYYTASVITDLDGNILKGTDTIVLEKMPCACAGDSGSVLNCRESMIGITSPDRIFTKEEFQRIAEVVAEDPSVTISSDRYLIGGCRDSVYTPLSVTVYSGKGAELFTLDLSRNEAGKKDERLGTDTIYFHDVGMIFGRKTETEPELKAAMEKWIQSVPTDRESIEAVKKKYPFQSVYGLDFAFKPSKTGFGPFHLDRAVYYGENIRVYCYHRTSMVGPFSRVLLILGVIHAGLHLPILLTLVIPYRRIRKAEKAALSAENKDVKADDTSSEEHRDVAADDVSKTCNNN